MAPKRPMHVRPIRPSLPTLPGQKVHAAADEDADAEHPAKHARVEEQAGDVPMADEGQEPLAETEEDAKADARKRLGSAVRLDPAEMTLNVVPTHGGRVLMSLSDQGLHYFLGCARASVGLTAGRYFFEVRILEVINAAEQRRPAMQMPKQTVRLGFSTSSSSLFLGDSEGGICFDSEGFLIIERKRMAVAKKFGRNQVVGVLLNLDQSGPNANTISLFCEGKRIAQPQPLPEACKGKALFPHVVFRNVSLQLHFGPEPMAPLSFKSRMLQDAAQADVEDSPSSVPKDGKYEVVFPVGVPDEGTFDWLDSFLEQNPHFTELSDRMLVEWAVKSGLTRPAINKAKHSNDKPELQFGTQALDELTMKKIIGAVAPLVPRHYIVMEIKSNLLHADRADSLKRFSAPHFQKVAEVVVGEPPEDYKQRVRSHLLHEKQLKLNEVFKVQHLERERKKMIVAKQKEMLEKRKQIAAQIKAKREEQEALLAQIGRDPDETVDSKEDSDMKDESAEAGTSQAEVKDESREESKEESKEEGKDESKEESKEAGKEESKEESKEETKKVEEESKPAEDLSKLTVVQLKDRLKEHSLPVSGNKVDLVARLKDHLAKAKQEDTKADVKMEDVKEEAQNQGGSAETKEGGAQTKEDGTETKEGGAETKQEQGEEEEEQEPEPPKADLTEEEQTLWFKPQASGDILMATLNCSFAHFALPAEEEGFDRIRYAWQDSQASQEYLKAWILQRKRTTRVEDLQPAGWFFEQLQEWQRKLQEWQVKQKDFKQDPVRKEAARLREQAEALKKKKAELIAAHKEKEAMEEAAEKEAQGEGAEEKKEEATEGEEKKAEQVEEAKEEEQAEEEAQEDAKTKVDIFTIEDIMDVDGEGEPLFANFMFEDWALMSLRFELTLLVRAFSHDVNDPDRPGMHEDHLLYYYQRYFRKSLNVKFFGKDTTAELVLLIKDSVAFDDGFLVSTISEDNSNVVECFVKLTEEARRERQRRIDAGDETAKLRIMVVASGAEPKQQGPGMLAPRVVQATRPQQAGGYTSSGTTWGSGGGGKSWQRQGFGYPKGGQRWSPSGYSGGWQR